MAVEGPIFVLALLITILLFLGYLRGLEYIVRYEVGSEKLQIRLFGLIPVRTIRLDEIEEIGIISARKDTLPLSREFRLPFLIAERWPSCVFQRRGVFIRKQKGLIKYFILSPRDPEEFVAEVHRRKRTLAG